MVLRYIYYVGQLITGLVLGNSTFSVPTRTWFYILGDNGVGSWGGRVSTWRGIMGIMEGSVPGDVGSVPGLGGTGPGLAVTDEVLGTFFANVPKLILLKLRPGFTLSAFSVG